MADEIWISKMKSLDKYILACALTLGVAGHGNAQNPPQNRRHAKTENVAKDSIQTMTHTAPFKPLREPNIPKNPNVKISNLDESLYIELETFTNATTDNVKCVFAPLVVIKPFIRFKDRFDIGITTTQMVQNYTSDKMTTLTHNMYAHAKLRTRVGNFLFQVGKFSAMNYAGDFLIAMPINNFFINALYMRSGHFYPRAIIGGFSNNEMAIQIGYAEENAGGLKFTGGGAVVIASEVFIEDIFKGGFLVTIGEKTVLDFQIVWTPNNQNSLLLEVTGINNQAGFHGAYKHTFTRGNMDIFVNGFKQTGDGVAGGAVGLRHTKSGAYAAIGATYHDPMHGANENYEKITPYAEFGIVRGFSFSK